MHRRLRGVASMACFEKDAHFCGLLGWAREEVHCAKYPGPTDLECDGSSGGAAARRRAMLTGVGQYASLAELKRSRRSFCKMPLGSRQHGYCHFRRDMFGGRICLRVLCIAQWRRWKLQCRLGNPGAIRPRLSLLHSPLTVSHEKCVFSRRW